MKIPPLPPLLKGGEGGLNSAEHSTVPPTLPLPLEGGGLGRG